MQIDSLILIPPFVPHKEVVPTFVDQAFWSVTMMTLR